MRRARFDFGVVFCCLAMLMSGAAAVAQAAPQKGANQQQAYQLIIAPPVRLQVSGAGDRLTVDAERADVQSTLRAVLKQAGRQFVPDATVTGQVTLLLTEQPLETVLKAVCASCYLKYSQTPSGIYSFSRDDEAVRKAFSQLGQLNAGLREQLRAMGLDVPADEQLGASRFRSQSFGAGGFGGAIDRSVRDAAKQDVDKDRNLLNGAPKGASSPLRNSEPIGNEAARKPDTSSAAAKKEAVIGNNFHAYLIPQSEAGRFLNQSGRTALGVQQDFGAFARQNGFVWFNIPEEKPEPVASVLQLFSQQSNVPILVDQSIPNSLKFRVWGSLSPRQLPEALNVLAPTAHLQWRWIGNSIFVVPAPSFSVSFGDQGSNRSQYPAPARGETNAPAGTGRGGSE